jgi:hypothetical protein
MKTKLISLSTCTNTKRVRPDDTCLLDNCHCANYTYSIKEWVRRLHEAVTPRYPARTLYQGSHWKETLQCISTAEGLGFEAELWVLSAGWGLIPVDLPICSYGATFSSGENSIHNLSWPEDLTPRDRARAWWQGLHKYRKALAQWSIPELSERVGGHCKALFLFVLSREYFLAVEPDLMELIGRGSDVAVVSAGLYSDISNANPMMRDHVLPVSDKFKQAENYLNHTNVSLNARLANWLIRKFPGEIDTGSRALSETVAAFGDSLPEMARRRVETMTDDEVLHFIAEHFDAGRSSATQLLRVLRHREGQSCEQKRFGRLFRQYTRDGIGGLFDG